MFKNLFSKAKISLLTFAFLGTSLSGAYSACAATVNPHDMTSQQIVNDMKVGWNLGNTLDASPDETGWGNPKTTKAMIDKIKEAGFNTVRIPVSWSSHIGAGPSYTIDQAWLNRVQEVVNYVIQDHMYAILNTHHDTSWIIPTYNKEAASTDELTKVWGQIANRFKDYDSHLIFETLNEPRIVGSPEEWNGGTAESRDVINKFNLTAVNTIRSTGSNNSSRFIMVPTYAASTATAAMNDLVIPNNDKRVIVSLHMYAPYSFAMDPKGTSHWGGEADKDALDGQLNAIYNKFVKNGQPVVIGEFGSINKNNESSRASLAKFYVSDARKKGITTVWWDNGKSAVGDDNYGILDRNNLTWVFPKLVRTIVNSAR
ncbi:endoglucanase [Clostridium acetobutylicum]|uniref:Endoglucanase family 5 n=1 Tax=Clostridium acetobutylicum (strain ATCC 824 / DSM 792 / JCM 1419 / IAM 19013 / LMG 5710 / NBRC 13948 / NRRL B-527 / VKM B-1787 / 2291 / W) TaxID=272562 RepID=Q97KU0_CLOAB|nr:MULTISPECIES: glycoside hydrolase family 5 protein [Clostridium]AAK78802.1 Endoglucanase family 5 [Clostridium acetobutylicum ATCC 824]ADZ19876.1 Endoglucanase family 5 [Clostridium acetobutylicum EA 2018]AEI34706.1 endoglucanase family protein 5 [Clostridium acetobutylicum DSM 1731]AWV80520.1 glycoside hydrolase family 5 protein [Clostridium acetobutylicum]MBC2392710.1 glycoside hydrolase family 5 protein [Clostridium acetobutylicum]